MKKLINKFFIIFIIYYIYKHYFSLKSLKLRMMARETFDKKYKKNLVELSKNGFTKIENYFSKEVIDEMLNIFQPILDSMDKDINSVSTSQLVFYDDNRKMIKKEFGYSRIYDLEHFFPKFKEIRLDKNVLGLASAYYGMKCYSYHALAQKTTYVPGNGQEWHYDDFEPRFKIIIYLKDVNIPQGPFSYIEGSNHGSFKKLKKFFNMRGKDFYKEQYFDKNEIDNSKERYLTAKAGDLLLADANGIHRGLKIEEGNSRYAIFSFYSPLRTKYKAKN